MATLTRQDIAVIKVALADEAVNYSRLLEEHSSPVTDGAFKTAKFIVEEVLEHFNELYPVP